MLYALVDGQSIEAQPGLRGLCPACGGAVLAKCGQIKIWHWSHTAADCDPWNEPETVWHKAWKSYFQRSQTEVVIGSHRADIVTKDKIVIELQHSSISVDEILEREAFYGEKMIWIVDGDPFWLNFTSWSDGMFTWKHIRKIWKHAQRPIFVDFTDGTPCYFPLKWYHQRREPESRTEMFYIKEFFEKPRNDKRIEPLKEGICVCLCMGRG